MAVSVAARAPGIMAVCSVCVCVCVCELGVHSWVRNRDVNSMLD